MPPADPARVRASSKLHRERAHNSGRQPQTASAPRNRCNPWLMPQHQRLGVVCGRACESGQQRACCSPPRQCAQNAALQRSAPAYTNSAPETPAPTARPHAQFGTLFGGLRGLRVNPCVIAPSTGLRPLRLTSPAKNKRSATLTCHMGRHKHVRATGPSRVAAGGHNAAVHAARR